MATKANGVASPSSSDLNSFSAISGSGKPSAKAGVGAASKNGDVTRKQTGNPNEGAPKRSNPPHKAWTGYNPITNAGAQNGGIQNTKAGAKSGAGHNKIAADRLGNERLLYLFEHFMGQIASITLKDGNIYSGLFFGSVSESHEPSYVLKMVHQVKGAKGNRVNGVKNSAPEYLGTGDDHAMSFNARDVIDLTVEGAVLADQGNQNNGTPAGFRTDTDISGNLNIRERDLQRWTPSGEDNVDMSLGKSNGTWDQFAANEQLFGLKSNYDENHYTTPLDRSSAQYKQQEARATRIAREIEGNASSNSHVREERGHMDEDGDADEEEKYSGVRREVSDYPPLQPSQPNRYMPPARRPPTGQSTVAGAPVDPAIISSQISGTGGTSQRSKEVVSNEDGTATAPAPHKETNIPRIQEQIDPADPPNVPVIARANDTSKPNAAANAETETLTAFRTFSKQEKTRLALEKQKRVRHDKDIKLNDLKGFSKNFKLTSEVPQDLIAILAKDPQKQREIQEKAKREAAEQSASASPSKASKASDESSVRPSDGRREGGRNQPDAQNFANTRPPFPHRRLQQGLSERERQHQGPYGLHISPPGNPGYLSHRLAENQRAHKAGIPVPIPSPLPIHRHQAPPSRSSNNGMAGMSSQSPSTVRTPTSATSTRLNVQAIEFKPNPAAKEFAFQAPGPSSTENTQQTATAKPVRPTSTAAEFFGNKKPIPESERPSITEHFNPLKRLREKAKKDGKDYASNGGIPHAYSTPVTWIVLGPDDVEKSYKDVFDDAPNTASGISPQPAVSTMTSDSSQGQQIPPHLQHSASQGSVSQHGLFSGPSQQHLYPNGAHHAERMQGSPSASAYSTPRMHNNYVAYPAQMGPAMQQYPYGQPLQPMMGPGGPLPPNFRGYPPTGPQYMASPGQQLAAPMMVQQGSQGGFMGPQGMGAPPMQMYGPGPPSSYNGPSQPPSGYPSPSRAAPMMMHQISNQGQYPQMHAGGQYPQPFYAQQPPPHMNAMRGYPSSPQAHYSQSPQQQYHYPPQHHMQRVPSHGAYQHLHQVPSQHSPAQQGPPSGPAVEGGEAVK